MKNWIFGIMLALLYAGHAHAVSIVFPPSFDGMPVTKEMVQTIPGKDGAVLVALKISVPPNANPMQGFREDMWSSKQLRADKHLASLPSGLTPAQQYAALFCLINQGELGFACKNSKEILTATTKKPWLIPIVVLPEKAVGQFTTFLLKGPIQVPEARVAVATEGSTAPTTGVGALLPWSDDSGVGIRTAPLEMEWYEGTPPSRSAQAKTR
jgi:hypothetical protein